MLQFIHLVLNSAKYLYAIREMKYALFLYTESDSTKAEQLKDYLQANLRKMTDFRNLCQIGSTGISMLWLVITASPFKASVQLRAITLMSQSMKTKLDTFFNFRRIK